MTLAQFSDNLSDLEKCLPDIIDMALNAGIDELDSKMTNRIFNGNEDINGKSFGKYKSEAYKELRQSLGKSIVVKDLQFNKDLLISFFKDYANKLIRFNNDLNTNKGRGQEHQMKTRIFEGSESEIEDAFSVMEEVFIEEINNCLGVK